MARVTASLLLLLLIVPSVAFPDGYKVRPGDELTITVREAAEFSGTFVVSEDGKINFPEVGSVQAAGRQVDEISATVRDGLQKGYLTRATVMIRVSRYTPVRYFVLGFVRSPGAFEIAPGASVTLLQAIAFAGGLPENADTTRITIIRKTVGSISVDLSPAFEKGDPSCDRDIAEDDIVIVPKKKELFAYVLGSVGAGGRVNFPANISSLPLGVVLALAGGIDGVSDGEVHLYPENALGVVTPQSFEITDKGLSAEALAQPVTSGQTVFVLDRKTQVYVLGKVNTPGAIQYRKGMTISVALAMAGGLSAGSAENRTRVITANADGSRTVKEVNLTKVLSPDGGNDSSDFEISPWTIIVVPESRI